jgi:hypothetical protein
LYRSETSLPSLAKEQLRQISQAAHAAALLVDEVVKKASIIVAERRNYASNTSRVYLTAACPSKQVLILDTAAQLREAVTGY